MGLKGQRADFDEQDFDGWILPGPLGTSSVPVLFHPPWEIACPADVILPELVDDSLACKCGLPFKLCPSLGQAIRKFLPGQDVIDK